MALPNAPIVLQLAPLPRTQIGPFLILGVDKDASREDIEAAWAEKVKQARRGQVKTPLEDINWAREMLTNKEARIRCDAVALNIDTTASTLKKLKDRHGFILDGGYGRLKGKTFRISNMGDETPATMRELLAAIDDCLG